MPKQKIQLFKLVLIAMPLIACLVLTIYSRAQASSFIKTTGLLVKFKDSVTKQESSKLLDNQDAQDVQKNKKLGVFSLKVPKFLGKQTMNELAANPKVEFVEPNHTARVFFTPNDTYFTARQWGFLNTGQVINGVAGKFDADIDAAGAWDTTKGLAAGSPVKIAILDTGIDQDHDDLSDKLILQNNFSLSPTVDDLFGHGTHVAGIAAADTNNSKGVAGACPACTLLNVKVLDDDGSGDYGSVSDGITWAADNGAKVINMSFGGSWPSLTLENAINYAWNKGVVVVAAAGNCGCSSKSYPGAYSNVIAVAATNNKDKKASFSSFSNKWVDVAAPGVDIFSTLPNNDYEIGGPHDYGYLSGTSMATPMTSGTVGLIWSSKYGTSASKVRSRLQSTAQKITGTGTYWSAGRINAATAVKN